MNQLKGKPLVTADIWQCRHCHNGISHPNCWREYLLEYSSKEQKIGFLDIEANGLQGDFNYMYSWAIKTLGKDEVMWDCMQVPDEMLSKVFDKRVTQTLIDAMRKYYMVVTYYGTGFDIPFIRTRALRWGLDFPSYGELRHHDLYYLVKYKLKIHSNSLASVTQLLHIEEKTPLEPIVWQEAMVDPTRMKYIVKHNIQDVIVLEEAYSKLVRFMKGSRRSI